jgi:uncharacterized protein YjiS (DUF1127 family)
MSAVSGTARTYGVRKTLGPKNNPLRRLLDAVSAWRRRCRQRAELHARSNLELNDIGICRCEIERIVRS